MGSGFSTEDLQVAGQVSRPKILYQTTFLAKYDVTVPQTHQKVAATSSDVT